MDQSDQLGDAGDAGDAMRGGRPLRANRGKNPNARWVVDEEPKKVPAKKRKVAPKPASAPTEIVEGEVRCRCEGKVSDDKMMAECENCSTWQHIVCEFGVDDESALPKPTYECFQCRESDDEIVDDAVKSEASEQSTEKVEKIADLEDKVRRSVAEAFSAILSEHTKLDAPESERLALEIESSLLSQFGDTENGAPAVGARYREQYRTLSFNLKDEKNGALRRRLVEPSSEKDALSPEEFTGMTSEQLRNPELKQYAEEVHEEGIRDRIVPEDKPPLETIRTGTAEVDVHETYLMEKKEDVDNEADLDEAMKQPLGPPPDKEGTPDVAHGAPKSEDDGQGATDDAVNEIPVWLGEVRLADNSVQFAAKGLHLVGAHRSRWPSVTGTELVVEGLVVRQRAEDYIQAMASSDEKHHNVVMLAVVSDDHAALGDLHDHMLSMGRVGSLKHHSTRVREAYLVSVDKIADVAFLGLGEDQTKFLEHLQAEHDAHKALVAVYVVQK